MVVFVPFTAEGERVRVQVLRRRKNSAEGRLLEVLESSPFRVTPPCPYFGNCGGCRYQHLNYETQLAIKSRQVEQTLRRIGKMHAVPVGGIIRSQNSFGYRNRIRVHVEGGRVGFFAIRSHDLVEIKRCAIAVEAVNARLLKLRARPLIDGDYMLAAEEEVRYFAQINDQVAQAMVRIVANFIRDPSCVFVDAYCGAGFFSRSLRDSVGRVIGIERNETAVECARATATDRETYLAADVGMILGEVLSREDPRRVVLLLDPPAKGIAPRVRDAIRSLTPETVIYVSCNPSTLARDLSVLGNEYLVEAVTPLDMFPQTAEIEVITCLRKKPGI